MNSKAINHLHVHTTFSFLDGYGLTDQFVTKLEENSQEGMAITDHGSTWGHIPFYFALKDKGLKLIPGVEFYYVPEFIEEGTNEEKRNRYHLTILPKNNTGLNNLYKLQTFANHEGFYYKPRINNEQLFRNQSGLIVLSGCMGDGVPIRNINDAFMVNQWLKEMKENIEEFYVEVSPIEDISDRICKKNFNKILDMADVHSIPIAVTSDVHFPRKEDHISEDLMLSIGIKSEYKDPDRLKLPEELYLWNNDEYRERCARIFGKRSDLLIKNTNKIFKSCNIEFKKATPLHFYKDDPTTEKALKKFKSLIREGWKFRNLDSKDPVYKERAKREMDMIIQKKYVNYFLIISDLVIWAKERMLVGPARGSVAGSLVAYLLRITEVNPIPHGLIFERFIDITRNDLPDIDLDFPHLQRNEVEKYLVKKYGGNHVSLLGTIGYFKSKNAIWDVGRVFNLPFETRKRLSEMIIERSSGDSRAGFCIEDSIEEFDEARKIVEEYPEYRYAAAIEGQARQSGVHAAAIVVSREPLYRYGSFAPYEDTKILCMDKKAAEKLDLLKIDVLALKQLTVIQNILIMLGKDNNWLYNLPLEDKEAYKILEKKLFQGIFQFEGAALKAVSSQSNPDDFHSMQEISALARPGALHCGGTTEYLDRRAYAKGYDRETKKPTKYVHPLIKKVSEDTYGVIIYQEQVMLIMRDVGNMSWKDTMKVRRLISKSMGVEYFNQFFDLFKKGALENGLTEEAIDDLWQSIATFGSWAFNKSHSVSYGYISYWTMYLKAHYPAEFYISSIQQQGDDDSIKYLLREWVNEFGGKVVPFDYEKSELNFSLKEGIIYGGFQNLKGIGPKTAERLYNLREESGTEEDFLRKAGKKMNDIYADPNIYNHAPWADLFPIGNAYPKYYKEFGFKYIRDVDDHTSRIRLIAKINKINLRSMKEVTVSEKILKGQSLKDDHLDKFFNLIVEDDTGTLFFGVNRYRYHKFKDQIYRAKEGGIIAIEGKKIPGFLKIQIEKMKVLKEAG